ncbi:unnamed protein product, partial [Callosobruchus maculatus]
MIDVPLKRLPPMCPPEKEEVCNPERICPVEVCLRADESLCVKPKKLPILEPKDCPCVEPEPMKDVRLKRLDLRMPEQPRVCPCVENCPCPRADDNLKPKVKKLRKIVPGECPCIEPEYRDVNFKRLQCIEEPEPCDLTDPCIPYPRADYGCWEYYQPPDPCEAKKKKPKKPQPRKIINFKPQKRCYSVEPRKDTFGVSVEKLKSNTTTRLEKMTKNQSTPQRNLPVKSLPKSKVTTNHHKSDTIALLDKLKHYQIQSSDNRFRFDQPRKSKLDVKKIMSSVSALEKENATATAAGAPVRNLSTILAPRLSSRTPPKTRDSNVSQRTITTTLPTSKKLMEGQIEPFSEFSEWTCKRKEYGFYPKTTKEFEPLDTKKNKKCYSTMSFNVKELLDEAPNDLRSG